MGEGAYMVEPLWFPRFAAISGVRYETPAGANGPGARSRYPQRPEIHRWSTELPPSLWWGDTSASPAKQHAFEDSARASSGEILANLAEVLELPGEPTDYHFAIQNAAETVWSQRRKGLGAFATVERLCWLDLQLIQAVPSTVRFESAGEERFYQILAFDRLLEMYLREGLLAEAKQVADIASRFGAGDQPRAQKARERAAAVAAEDGSR
jgi:hypothetical protein